MTNPNSLGAAIEIGRCDYVLQIPVCYDFVLLDHGELIDRGTGALAVTSLEQLQKICAQHNRLWVAGDREGSFVSRGQRVLWQYPAARVETYLRQNLQLMYRTHLWNVYLWDTDNGVHHPFRHAGE